MPGGPKRHTDSSVATIRLPSVAVTAPEGTVNGSPQAGTYVPDTRPIRLLAFATSRPTRAQG